MKSLEELSLSQGWETFLAYRDRKLAGVQTGIAGLDRALLGLSGITVVQGAPGCNKSTLVLQVAQYQATLGNPTLVIDRENGRERFRERLVCMANRVSSVDVRTCSTDRLRELVSTVLPYPIYACTDAVRTVEELREAIGALWEKYKRPTLLVVDSLQALPFFEGFSEERLSLQAWLGAFDQLKLDFEGKLTILVTSEKSRGEGGRNYDNAALNAGKGSGAVEYKAEVVLDLRRGQGDQKIVCEVLKNRDGASGLSVELAKVLANPANKQSFCFRLQDSNSGGVL